MLKKTLISASKRVLNESQYNRWRSRFVFRDLESPFPLYPIQDFNMNWNQVCSFEKKTRAVYIVSPTQRSGTNFLSHIMNMHPKLIFPSKEKFPDEHCLFTYIEDLKKYVYKTSATWSKWTNGDQNPSSDQAKKLMSYIGDGILNYFSEDLCEDELLLLKTPDAGNFMDFFHLFPSTKVVLLIRDGRDTVESFLKSWGGSASFGKMTNRWKDRMIQIEKLIERAKEAGIDQNIYCLKYDNLNSNTEEELSKIFDFLDLDASIFPWDKLKQTPVLGSSSYRGGEKDVHWKPIAKTNDFKPSGKWMEWGERKKSRFKKIAGKELVKFGFAENNAW